MILAWRWEDLGGTIAAASLLAFYAAWRIMAGEPYFALIRALAILFLLSWAINVVTGWVSPG